MADLKSLEVANVIRVLHVDDDESFLEISKQILMEMGSFRNHRVDSLQKKRIQLKAFQRQAQKRVSVKSESTPPNFFLKCFFGAQVN